MTAEKSQHIAEESLPPRTPTYIPEGAEFISEDGSDIEHGGLSDKSVDFGTAPKHEIPERKLTSVQATFLLASEYVVLAILSIPGSFAALGIAGGILASFLVAISVVLTSHILWRFCLINPRAQNICDLTEVLTGSKIMWWISFVGLALNNYFICGLHVNAAATAIQTIRGGSECTLDWAVGMALIMFVFSLIRDYNLLSKFSFLATITMFACYLLVTIAASVQKHPNHYEPSTPSTWTVWAPKGTSFAQGVSALMNLVYTYNGQALVPSFVLDMEKPEHFPICLYIVTAVQFVVYTSCGVFVYYYAGQEYVTSPAYGALMAKYGKVAAGFIMPTCLILGMTYSMVVSKSIFQRIFHEGSRHRTTHTVAGWTTWIVIVFVGWVISFVIGEGIPFFSDLVSLISSIFDSWFCYFLWGWAGLVMLRASGGFFRSPWTILETALCVMWILMGLFFEGGGDYASVATIISSYDSGSIKKPFQCTNSGFLFSE